MPGGRGGFVISFPIVVYAAAVRIFRHTFRRRAALVSSLVVTAQRVLDAEKPKMGPIASLES